MVKFKAGNNMVCLGLERKKVTADHDHIIFIIFGLGSDCHTWVNGVLKVSLEHSEVIADTSCMRGTRQVFSELGL